MKHLDKNGIEIIHLASVLVPEPNETDIHLVPFAGTATDLLDNGNIIVEDQDSDFFEIEANRLEVIPEGEKLIQQVIDQIIEDVNLGDCTAIAELLRFVPEENLKSYLPEKLSPILFMGGK
jgi:hypothetical protein